MQLDRTLKINQISCEIFTGDGSDVYQRDFLDIHFPTDYCSLAVLNMLVEDSSKQVEYIAEMFRVVAQYGKVHITLPLSLRQIGAERLSRAGFIKITIIKSDNGIVVLQAVKPEQYRKSLLLPPGIGDVYWSLVKTESFLRKKGISPPVDVYVAAPRMKNYNSERRSFPFLEMFPFLHSTGQVRFNRRDPIWREAYLQQRRTIFQDVHGCDYFITWNGYLRAGKTLELIDPNIMCNWELPRFISFHEDSYRTDSIKQYGDYIVLYWSFMGKNRQLLDHFSVDTIALMIRQIVKETGLTPILIGAVWDLDCPNLHALKMLLPENTVDLRGETTIEEVFGLMRGAKVVVGMNSGMTIMSSVFGVKTVMLIHKYLFTEGVHRNFALNTVPPSVRGKTYFAEFADSISPENFIDRVVSLYRDEAYQIDTNCIKKNRPYVSDTDSIDQQEAVSSIRSIDVDGKVTVVCVLKSGGPYTIEYVKRLYNMILRNTNSNFSFVCLSDMNINFDGCRTVKLNNDYSGWWSKIELFRDGIGDSKYMLYFDLDTVITDNIDQLFQLEVSFAALRPWNHANRAAGMCASGMMLWENRGTYSFLYDNFDYRVISEYPSGDQQYISAELFRRGKSFQAVQDLISGIYSYKRNCRNGLPKDARVVCFHGRPRLHEVQDGWVLEHWR